MKTKQKQTSKLFAALLVATLVLSLFAPMAMATVATSTPTPTPTPTLAPVTSGDVKVTGYTVLDAAGNEIQKVQPGQKCQIVISLLDERYGTGTGKRMPAGTDTGTYANVKITSTTSFTPPSLGDIRLTTIAGKDMSDGLKYGIIFNDITYLGGSNTLSFDLSYADQSVPLVNLSQAISQCSASGSSGNSSIKPSVMVQDSNYGKPQVAAGETFTLNLTSYNTSKSTGISNVTTTLTLPETLTLAGGSNSVMTANVAAGGSFTNAFQLMAQPSAATGIANITVQYTFYSATGEEQLTASQMITVSIVQPDRFSFSSMEVPDEIFTGEENTISLGFVNKGKGILYNVSAEISGNLKNPGQTQYLGNLQPGAEGSVDFVIAGESAGTVSGTITLTYEDIAGNQTTQTKEYSVTVTEMTGMDESFPGGEVMPGMDPVEPKPAGMPVWVWAIIIVVVVVGAVVAIKIVKKRKAQKELRELEEEDEDN